MSTPTPKKSLSGHCSVVKDDVLYVLSPDAFQSLPLKENATWSLLPTGESVTGAACVKAVPNGDESQAALYVIGGTSDDDSYGGMQRFFFANQSWETITPLTTDMKGRTDHAIAYLNDSASILVYAGSQPASKSDLSSQTFLISVDSPYDISSFVSKAPPANQPILLPWDSNSAVMVGGEETNTRIFTFDPDQGWDALDTNLTSALPTGARGALVTGSDGSKVLEVYDATKSPNEVQQLVLLGASGKTASNGETVGSSTSSSSSRKRKRDLTLSNWPEYNSTNAPTAKRSDYNVAQSSDGLAVITGGNDDEPLNIFNQQKNTWEDNEAFFGSQEPLTSATPSATSSSTAAATSSAATATAEPAGVKQATSNNTRRTLGITLGVLAGIALLFVAALLYFRWRKNRSKAERNTLVNEKDDSDRMSFADRGASFMKEAGGSVAELNNMGPPPSNRFQGHAHQDSQSSLAMFGGGYNPNGTKRVPEAALAPPPRFPAAGRPDSQGSIAMFNGDYKGKDAGGPRAPATQTQMATLAPPSAPFHDGKGNGHSSLAIIAGKFNRHSRNTGEKGSFESTTRLVRSPSAEARNEDNTGLNEISNRDHSSETDRDGADHHDHLAPAAAAGAAAALYEHHSAEPSPLQVKKRSSGWSKYFAPNEQQYQPAHANASNVSMSQYEASRNPSMNPSLSVPPLDLQYRNDVEAQRVSAVAKGRPSFQHSHEDLAARGASLDSVRPQTAVFHTGNSLEPESFLGGRESYNSRDSRRHSADSMSRNSRITSSVFFSGNDGPLSSNTSAWTPMSAAQHVNVNNGLGGHTVKKIDVSPRIGQLQREKSSASGFPFPRPPSSTYSASIAPGRDSRQPLDDYLGRALSPPAQGPAVVQIPGPAARAAAKGNSGFFPNNKDDYRPGSARKLGGLHPGTLAALSHGSNMGPPRRINPDGGNRDSDVTEWPSDEPAPSSRFQQERERLMREKAMAEEERERQKAMAGVESERERMERQAREMRAKEVKEGTTTGDSVMSGISEYSWLNLGAQK